MVLSKVSFVLSGDRVDLRHNIPAWRLGVSHGTQRGSKCPTFLKHFLGCGHCGVALGPLGVSALIWFPIWDSLLKVVQACSPKSKVGWGLSVLPLAYADVLSMHKPQARFLPLLRAVVS